LSAVQSSIVSSSALPKLKDHLQTVRSFHVILFLLSSFAITVIRCSSRYAANIAEHKAYHTRLRNQKFW